MTHRARIAVTTLLAVGLGWSALPAAEITLDASVLDTFTQLGSSHAGTFTGVTPHTLSFSGETEFQTIFTAQATPTFMTVDVGATGLGLDWTGFDTFKLLVTNTNEDPWSFTLTVKDGSGGMASTGPVVLNPIPPGGSGEPKIFEVSLAGLDLTDIDAVILTVGGTIPQPHSQAAEYRIAPIPEPATVALLGSALVGLGFASARRRRREKV